MKIQKNILSLVLFISFVIFCSFYMSCLTEPLPASVQRATPIEIQTDYSFPLQGSANNVNITADFIPVGIIFVESEEVIDGLGNHKGKKITYEMFMREASILQAHEVININIDLNIKREKQNIQNRSVVVTTYSYTGTGLAIRYANASLKSTANSTEDLPESMIVREESGNSNAFKQFSSDAPASERRFTVSSINGNVSRDNGQNQWLTVRAGSIFSGDTNIRLGSTNSSVVFVERDKRFTIYGPRTGKIADLIE